MRAATGYSRQRIVNGVGIIDRFGMYNGATHSQLNLITNAFARNGATSLKIYTNAVNPTMKTILEARMKAGRGFYGMSISKRTFMPGYILKGGL